jgi:predicted DNA-binding protein (MmcQ/YjbR family)
MVYSTFLGREWSIVRSALLAKGGTSKKRPSPHLHKVLNWNNKASSKTFQTTLIYSVIRASWCCSLYETFYKKAP